MNHVLRSEEAILLLQFRNTPHRVMLPSRRWISLTSVKPSLRTVYGTVLYCTRCALHVTSWTFIEDGYFYQSVNFHRPALLLPSSE